MDGRQSRKRAVRLKPEALAQLNDALIQAWGSRPGQAKLTRDEKACLLGLSLATSERLLKGKGVDRATITLAFKNLNLAWNDSFCEHEVSSPRNAPEESQPNPESEIKPAPLVSRRFMTFATSAFLFLIGLNLTLRWLPSERNPEDWKAVYGPLINQADNDFRAAKYESAKLKIDQAIEIAREAENAPALAGALRFAGDLAGAAGDFPLAKRHFLAALYITQSLHELDQEPPLYEAAGNAAIGAGELDQAEEYFTLSKEGFEREGDKTGVAMACRGLGTVASKRNQLTNATTWFMRGLKSIEGTDKLDLKADLHARLALVLRDQGKLTEARTLLSACLSHWTAQSHPRWIATVQLQLASIDALEGRREEALLALQQSRNQFQRLGDQSGVSDCDHWMARSAAKKR